MRLWLILQRSQLIAHLIKVPNECDHFPILDIYQSDVKFLVQWVFPTMANHGPNGSMQLACGSRKCIKCFEHVTVVTKLSK